MCVVLCMFLCMHFKDYTLIFVAWHVQTTKGLTVVDLHVSWQQNSSFLVASDLHNLLANVITKSDLKDLTLDHMCNIHDKIYDFINDHMIRYTYAWAIMAVGRENWCFTKIASYRVYICTSRIVTHVLHAQCIWRFFNIAFPINIA